MKKIILLLSLCILASPLFSLAKQGCCSRHGGVAYCASNGRYVCNDGSYSPSCTCSSSIYTNFSTSLNSNLFTKTYNPDSRCQNEFGLNSKYWYSDNNYVYCDCKDGYTWNNSNTKCISYDAYCKEEYGIYGISDIYGNCSCKIGYKLSINGSECVSYDEYCKEKYGNYSIASIDGDCKCKDGYTWNDDDTSCVSYKDLCKNSYGSNVTANKSGMCICESGYSWNPLNLIKDSCISDEKYCKQEYGEYAYSYKNGVCVCEDGYVRNENEDKCISYEESCHELYGYNSTYIDSEYVVGNCVCKKGYMRDKDTKTTCVEDQRYQFARKIYQQLTKYSNPLPDTYFHSIKIENGSKIPSMVIHRLIHD